MTEEIRMGTGEVREDGYPPVDETSFKTTSPTPNPVEIEQKLPFDKVIRALLNGKKITKEEWDNREIYGFIETGYLKLRRDGKTHDWILSQGDLEGEDYVVFD